MIQMKDVSKVYEIGNEKLYALNNASLTIQDGEFVAIIGPSGSGKSTMMNIIGCLDTADSGEYILDGQEIDDYTEDELTRVRNFKIGFVFQNFNLLNKLSALENVELPLIYQGVPKKEYHARALEALDRIGLSDRIHHKPAELSGGQQQRVAVARALVTQPSLILADEPTGNLDHKTGVEILELFSELHKNGNTIILITHDDKIAQQAQRRIRILDGRVMEDESA
ncbi:MAG: ABC transporter ATP-binding protein [Christensenella sp.]|uniref:ABC transporter ATP-binding protein n=1 Tax=Christensenella sp. TaxID=1935934 RepID=UPI002B1FCC10|nr:ABC transporter ATP-binding protein [Christensenella sp.]MEA5002689.1 ABC transporter ATP-binding protein [Christensenella sp.]